MADVYKMGCTGTDTLAGKTRIVVGSAAASFTAGAVQAFYDGTTQYKVTAGTTFHVTDIYDMPMAAGGLLASVALIYADNAALTTNVVVIRQFVCAYDVGVPLPNLSDGTETAPSGKYIGVKNTDIAGALTHGFVLGGYES